MSEVAPPPVIWRKSSRSSTNGGECVEVANFDGAVAVRDSKSPEGPRLRLTRTEWEAFTCSVKAGRHIL